MAQLKLSAIKEPTFDLEVAEGDVRSVDPWKAQEEIGQSIKDGENEYDAIRKAFGFPTGLESELTSESKATLTRHQCMTIQAALLEFITNLDCSKKLKDLTQN